MLERFLQTLMDGLAVGSLYALIALGYTMVYGILKFINFAHSDVFVLGAWTSFTVALFAGWGFGGAPNEAFWMWFNDVPRWIWFGLGALVFLAGLAHTYRVAIAPRLDPAVRQRLPDPAVAHVLTLVAAWVAAILTLVFVARGVHRVEALRPIGGAIILLGAMLTCGLVGFTVERLAYKPLRRAPRLNVLITAIGISLLLQNLGQLNWVFGTRPQGMPTLIPDKVLATIGGGVGGDGVPIPAVVVRLVDVLGAGTAVVLMLLLDRLIFHSKLGRAMRAVSFNPTTAALMGIAVDRIISFTFVLGAMLAAAAGFLYSQKYSGLGQTASATWVLLGLKAFVAAVVGGIGNIRGAMLGGLLIGLLEFFGAQYSPDIFSGLFGIEGVGSNLKDVYVFGLLIIVLLVRPAGILGSAVREKV